MTELDLHKSVAGVLEKFGDRERWMWTHLPMGGKRPIETAVQLKAMGVKRGWPDFIFLDYDGRPYFLELKSKTGDQSAEQLAFFRAMRLRGIDCRIARNLGQALEILSEWRVITINIAKGQAA